MIKTDTVHSESTRHNKLLPSARDIKGLPVHNHSETEHKSQNKTTCGTLFKSPQITTGALPHCRDTACTLSRSSRICKIKTRTVKI